MSKTEPGTQSTKQPSISDHKGIVAIEPKDHGEKLEIAFDPAELSEMDVRKIAEQHIQPDSLKIERRILRLDGRACEGAACRLERRIEQVPGVRRATATYIGHVLCLTFDSTVADEAAVLAGAREAGARIQPIQAPSKTKPRPGLWKKLFAGELNEELFCALGLSFLIAAGIVSNLEGQLTLSRLLYVGAYFFGGFYGVRSAIGSLKERTLDVDVLMVLAALGAAAIGSPFEGALLLFLFSLSNVLQSHALDRTQRAIESLLTLRPEDALRKNKDHTTELVAIDDLELGDTVIVRPGELIPVDGTVTEGRSSIDEASLTGESIPVEKAEGAPVFSGTLNQSGALEIRVDKKVEDSTLARMVRLVAEAQAEKSSAQRFLEKAEQGYAAGVIVFTLLVLGVSWLAMDRPFASAFYLAMTAMVVASPCALVISTPATVLSAIGGAARCGILIKGGSHLETAARVNIVCFDKTGTLTHGKPIVTDALTSHGHSKLEGQALSPEARELLQICAAIEAKSEHPLAAAIVSAAAKAELKIPTAIAFQSTPGKGAEAEVDGQRFVVGSERLFTENHAKGAARFKANVQSLQDQGKTCIWLGRRQGADIEVLAVFGLADTLREGASDIVEQLRRQGVKKVVMLTGDHQSVARSIAQQAGIDEFHAELLPEDKVEAVRQLKREGTVMMVGDGVNDSPALAASHLGIAMGAAGTDIAMETADVVLMGDKLDNVALLLGLARRAKRVLIQNLVFASGVIVLLLAATLGLSLPLPLGVVGHEGSTVLVCLNGLRLLALRRSSS